MREAKFRIETYGNNVFEGYTLNEEWNGWACPYFTFEESKKILVAHLDTWRSAGYDENADFFYFDIQDEWECYESIEIDGKKLYPIGDSSWIWEEVLKIETEV